MAALRGDPAAAVTAARRALERVAPGAVCYRVWTAMDMAPVLAENGAPDVARAAVDEALATLDACFPGARGRVHRAGLLASRARLEYDTGEPERACASLARCWEEAGPQADQVIRAHWPGLRPALWHALAEGALSPDDVLPAMRDAFPGGEALMAMVDHPAPAVRRAALSSALAAGHPAALARLGALARTPTSRSPLPRPRRWSGCAPQRPAAALRAAGRVPRPPRGLGARRGRLGAADGRARRALPADQRLGGGAGGRPVRGVLGRSPGGCGAPAPGRGGVARAQGARPARRAGERDRGAGAHLPAAAAANATASTARSSSARPPPRSPRPARTGRGALERAAALWTGEPLPEDRYAAWSFAWRERLAADLLAGAERPDRGARGSRPARRRDPARRSGCSRSSRSTRTPTGG